MPRAQAKKTGWKIQHRPTIKYTTIFGELEIESPYVWNKKLKKGIRPVAARSNGFCGGAFWV